MNASITPSSLRCILSLLLACILVTPGTLQARPRSAEEISFAALQGRVWVLALVDFLHDTKLSEKDRKAIYSLYLYHELRVAGLDAEHTVAPPGANTEIYQRTLGSEFLERLTQSLRVPFERPYIENPKFKATEPQKLSIEAHFRKLVHPIRSADKDKLHTPEWLTDMELSSVLIKDLKASLHEWESGKVIDEDENEDLYEAVQEDLEKVIDRIDEDEDLINEAWKTAATEWLNE